jgi:hypothetical protein
MTNGAQAASILNDESATMTEAEWSEYCQLLRSVRNPESEAKRIDRENVAAFEVQMQQASGKCFNPLTR